jgi:hypothetical protein
MTKYTVRIHVGPSWSKDYPVNAIDEQDAAKKAKAHAGQFDRVDVAAIWSTQVRAA